MTTIGRLRIAWTALLLGTYLSLAAFACAALPDPVWVSGISDGADDDDDLVLAEMAMTASVVTGPTLDEGFHPSLPLELPGEPVAFRIALPRAFQIRAPPPALAPLCCSMARL